MKDIIPGPDKGPLNLQKRVIRLPATKFLNFFVIGLVSFVFLFNLTAFAPGAKSPTFGAILAAENSTEESSTLEESTVETSAAEQRRELEEQLEELERKMAEQRRLIEETKAQGRTLQSEINRLDAEIRQMGLQIEAISLTLQKLAQEIVETEESIEETEERIETHKEVLGRSLRNIYKAETQSMIVILLQNDQISDFFNNINDILLVQDNVKSSLGEIEILKERLAKEREELQTEREDTTNLRNLQQAQRNRLRETQNERADLLEITKNQESLYQELLEETRKTADEVRAQIFRFVGGGELNFETAYELARLAEGQTGIRAALVLAILSRESNFGNFLGGCYYNQIISQTGLPAMHPTRDIPVFEAILSSLGREGTSPSASISCPIVAHGNHGGAMGPAQFIPSTWAIFGGYEKVGNTWRYNTNKDRIGSITGNKPSDPWNNMDAITATSLYIKDLYETRACRNFADKWAHSYPRQESQEECAAAQYYSGGRWERFINFYGIPVRQKADEYQRDIDILEGRI